MDRWTDRSWIAEAHAWIAEHVALAGERIVGPIEQPHIRPWSTVLRAPTDGGVVWFKANIPRLAYEARVAALIAQDEPEATPELLAVDPESGWMLARDAGERLREILVRDGSLRRWLEVLPHYADLQIAMAPRADVLVGDGVPDRRLTVLPRQLEQLLDHDLGLTSDEHRRMRQLVPWVAEACGELDALGIHETIQHDDLHDGQVFQRGKTYLFADWNDACVAHPFFSMSVTLEGVIAWGMEDVENSEDLKPYRDAYLEPFTAFATHAKLDSGLDKALRLGWICRALTYATALYPRDVDADDEAPAVRLRMFLGGLPPDA